jgi:beta-fructofuranosidase
MTQPFSASHILNTTVLLLHFDSLTAPSGYTMAAGPAVRAGLELTGGDQAASLARGGDGRAAEFAGGAVTLRPAPIAARAHGQGFSFCLRVRDPGSAWNCMLLSDADSAGVPCLLLSATEADLVFDLFSDFRAEPLRMSVPLSSIGKADWHDVIGRYSGSHVELFVDGTLVDEEWPLGVVGGAGGGTLVLGGGSGQGFRGIMDHFAVWDRALDDVEIQALSGTVGQGSFRASTPSSGSLQYGRAPGGGNVGDCFPFFHEGVYHFFYLFDRRHHASKFGLGAHQWAHASSSDLVHWNHHPLAVPITDTKEGSICTGSVFFSEGTWYAFYATRLPDRSEHLSLAVSSDGISFTKTEPNPFASPHAPYRNGPFRDPHVFGDPHTGIFHMLVTTELEHPAVAGRGGCLAHLTSSDLLHWEQRDPFLVTGYGDQPECSELFEWHGWYYLVFSHYGVAHYRMAKTPFGPWVRPRVDMLDGPLARVMKSATFTGDRRVGAFFLSEGVYAGRAVFREIIQHADGTLGSSWPQEMVPRGGEAISPCVEALGGRVAADAKRIRVDSPQGFSAAALDGLPRRFLLTARVRPVRPSGAFGIGVRGSGNFRDALMLEFLPTRRRVGWRHAERASWQEEETAALYEVDGLDRPFGVELVVLDDILDLCIDRRRTLINRASLGDGNRLFLYCHECEVEFDQIVVRPLVDP